MGRTLGTMLAAVALLGCVSSDGGGGGTSAACSGDVTCGGDPTGSWSIDALCDFDMDEFGQPFDDPACADALTDVTLTPSGGFTLDESGNLNSMLTADVTMTVGLTEACLSALSGMTLQWTSDRCAAMADNLDQVGDSASCSLSGTTCSCTVTQSGQPLTTSTTFAVEGNELTEPDGTVSSFCQEGDSLRIASPIGTLAFSRD